MFAGHLHDATPLRTWDGDDHGIPIRWISVGSFTNSSRRHAFDNPGVEAAFRDLLRDARPDVIHLHSLQTMGGGLVRVSKESGAAVVVTMHDFWWVCARQFLVPPSRRPCSLVVAAGRCPCARNHPWLEQRDRALAEQLRFADLVLTPSGIAADLLVANGIDARVDENGLPPAPPPAPRVDAADVRLLYAGGADPMKGWPTLRAALGALAGTAGWRLSAYGLSDGPQDTRVRLLPAYRHEELGAVLAGHDVLVLPSLMRESFSILTREALAAGLAVVCTDTLGPEEAVVDGVNGLVVPAGDDAALGSALRRIVTDGALRRRLQAGHEAAAFRTVEDQVSGLEAAYAGLMARSAPEPTRQVRRVLFVAGIDGAPLRYRCWLPAEGLALLGVHADVLHYRDPSVPALAAQADAVVVYRVPATPQVLDLIAEVRRRTPAVPVLFDVDDLIFDESMRPHVDGIAHLPGDQQELWWQGVRRYRTTLEACDGFVGSTDALCEHATRSTGVPAVRFANGVGLLLGQVSDLALGRPRSPGPLRLGYFSGTDTHDRDWAAVEPAIATVLSRHPGVELWLGGTVRTGPALAPLEARIRRLPFCPWWQLPRLLRDVDVNLAPLSPGSPFNEAKSAIKWLEAALVATPTVATPTQPFVEAVTPGVDGFLAGDVDAWVEHLSVLLADTELRRRVGERARRTALLRWSPYTQGASYLALLTAARDRVALGRRDASFTAYEVVSEPSRPTPLSPYGVPGLAGPRPPGPVRRALAEAVRYARATVSVARDDGPGEVAARIRAVVAQARQSPRRSSRR